MKNQKSVTAGEACALLDKADELVDQSKFAEAEKIASELISSKFSRKDDEARALCILGLCCRVVSKFDDALKHYSNALTAAEFASNLSLQSIALGKIAGLQNIGGDSDSALETAERALVLAEGANDTKEQGRITRLMGVIYCNRSDYSRGMEYLNRALAVAEELGDKKSAMKALGQIGYIQHAQGNYILALDYFTRSLTVAEEFNDMQYLANSLRNIGGVYDRISDYQKAMHHYSQALKYAEEVGDKQQASMVLSQMGLTQAHLGDYQLAIEYCFNAIVLCEEIGDNGNIARYLLQIGQVYARLADYSHALEYFFRSLAKAEDAGARTQIGDVLGNIGLVLMHLGDNVHALEQLERARTIAEELGLNSSIATNIGNIGCVYLEQGEYEKGLTLLDQALKLSVQLGALRPAGYWMHGLARAHWKLGNFVAARQGFVDTLNHRRNVLNSNEDIAGTLLDFGRLLLEAGTLDEGIARFDEAILIADELGEKKSASEAHKELASAFANKDDTAKAYHHLMQHLALDKEIFTEESRKKVETFNMRVAIANKERDAELAKLRAEQAEAALRLKERDLANTASSLAAQTELLGNFRADLRKIVLRPDRYEPEDIIRQVKAKLKELPCEMIDFSKFEGQFATVHPEFRARLETTYPELTPQEVKMCMLIHVNLQTAAIARLMCLSERTVEDHRANVRKKMSLQRSDDLAKHLRTIDAK